jgi:hypothetical protein
MPEDLYRNRHYNNPGHARELAFSCFHSEPYLNDPVVCKILFDEIEKAR